MIQRLVMLRVCARLIAVIVWAGFLAAYFSAAFSQPVSLGENTDLWRVRGMAGYGLPANTGEWHGDSLWIGATFMRDTTKKFIVWLARYYQPQASYRGALYLMVPRPGKPDSALFLFYNRCNATETPPIADSRDLTSDPLIRGAIHHMDTLFFMYRSPWQNSGGGACQDVSPFVSLTTDRGVRQDDSLFTGPNRAPGEGWQFVDRHYSLRNISTLTNPALSTTFFSLNQQKNVSYGRRWCEAGWVHTVRGGDLRTDTVEFGFEDQFNGDDINYEDIRFNVTGVFLIAVPNRIDMNVFPSDTIRAGDTALVIGRILDQNGQLIPGLSDSIQWSQVQVNVKPGDRILVPQNDSTRFTGAVAYRRIGVIGTYRNGTTVIIDTAWVYIIPNVPTQADIDLQNPGRLSRTQVLAQIDSFNVRPQLTATLTVGQPIDYFYAVLRDRWGNYCWLADSSQWTSLDNTIAGVVYSVNGAFECTVNRGSARQGTTKVIVSENGLRPDTAIIVMSADTLVALRIVDVRNPSVAIDTIKLIQGDSMTVKVQARWASDPTQWADVTGTWTVNPANTITFGIPLPAALAGQWTCNPLTPGATKLTVVSLNASVTVPVLVLPGPAGLDSAITRDINGNGLIDRIDLYFKRDIAVNNPSGAGIGVKMGTILFIVDSMRALSSNSYAAYIREQQTSPNDPVAQSSWTPTVLLSGIADVQNASIVALDGCQPVAWKADLYGASSPKLDTMRVVLSEKITGQNGVAFSTATSPYATFNAWLKNQGGSFTLAPDKFIGIGSFLKIERDSILYFLMSNDSAIADAQYINLKYQPPQVRDTRGTIPTETNQKVPIKIHGPFGFTVIAGPNPFVIGTTPFSIANQPSCCVKIEVTLIVPNGPIGTSSYVAGQVTIFDAVGNVLVSDRPLARDEKDAKKMLLIWDGKNRRGGTVAGGTYVARVTLTKMSTGETNTQTVALGLKTAK